MSNGANIRPAEATHPGILIRDELTERGLTQKQLAQMAGLQPSVLSETINGKRSVSLNMAQSLEHVLGIPASIWLNLQTQYDLDKATLSADADGIETVSITLPSRDRNLLQELARKFGWACVL